MSWSLRLPHNHFFPLTIMSDQEQYKSIMSDQEQYEYDDMDLGQTSEQFKVGEPKPIESLSSLINRIEAKQSYPKENMRKLWR